MANATRDPLFWAALDVANNDVPGVGDFCLRCHTPQGWYSGRVSKDGLGGQVNGEDGCQLLGDQTSNDNKNSDFSGITCHLCHRQASTGPMGESLKPGSGNLWVDDEDCDQGFGPCRKGPYDYNLDPTNQAPHAWEYDDFLHSGAFCGSCHDVSSPVLTGGVPAVTLLNQGVDTGLAMPFERTYTEWKLSDFGDLIFRDGGGEVASNGQLEITVNNSCQACHMNQVSDPDARACRFTPEGSRQDNMRSHMIAGGSSWMPQVLKAEFGTALDRNDAYDAATNAALDMLQNRSATVSVTDAGTVGPAASIDVRVTNLTGHKLPTGYPEGRRMWLHVEARDAANTLVFESGAYDDATAVLTEDAQAKVYEILQGIWNSSTNECVIEQGGSKVFHFVQNNCINKDNRIPPAGFRGAGNIEVMPIGITYPTEPGDPGKLVNYDITNYQFTIPVDAVLPVTVTARLRYQTASKEYIDFLANEATDNMFDSEDVMCNRTSTVGPGTLTRGDYMQQLWNDNGKSAPVDMALDVLQL